MERESFRARLFLRGEFDCGVTERANLLTDYARGLRYAAGVVPVQRLKAR